MPCQEFVKVLAVPPAKLQSWNLHRRFTISTGVLLVLSLVFAPPAPPAPLRTAPLPHCSLPHLHRHFYSSIIIPMISLICSTSIDRSDMSSFLHNTAFVSAGIQLPDGDGRTVSLRGYYFHNSHNILRTGFPVLVIKTGHILEMTKKKKSKPQAPLYVCNLAFTAFSSLQGKSSSQL